MSLLRYIHPFIGTLNVLKDGHQDMECEYETFLTNVALFVCMKITVGGYGIILCISRRGSEYHIFFNILKSKVNAH